MGAETVLFRHEKTLVNRNRYAVAFDDSMTNEQIDFKIANIKAVNYIRIGEEMKAEMIVLEYRDNKEGFLNLVNRVNESGLDVTHIIVCEDVDISKEAINMATKYTKDVYWLVGNSKNLPIVDHSLDFITALFTVVNQDELKRTLKKGGYIIHVTANPNHLIEIKELIYDEIKVKSDKYIRLDFETIESYDLVHQVKIDNREDALNLLKMTPQLLP